MEEIEIRMPSPSLEEIQAEAEEIGQALREEKRNRDACKWYVNAMREERERKERQREAAKKRQRDFFARQKSYR